MEHFEVSYSLSFQCTSGHATKVDFEAGTTTFFVGANGTGKTRLAVHAESTWGEKAHRIAAHRALTLDPAVAKISERKARSGLRFGYDDAQVAKGSQWREGHRWHSKAETILLNDFDYLVQTLFAEQTNIALETHTAAYSGVHSMPTSTALQKLSSIWNRILPHRKLLITGDDIRASSDDCLPYSASELSDGERAVFYMLGQVLVAEQDSALIFDEPELHVHRAILAKLWDEVEAVRPDCTFLVITHDLEFAASRPGQKYVLRQFHPPAAWDIESVPDNSGFSEEVATLILGSRKPVLFVEGTDSSLDMGIYRACYPDWTVLPRGSCSDVIHSVVTMRNNASLTRVTCSGLVDADDFSDDEKHRLSKFGVATLPVSEIENLFLLPGISGAILEGEMFQRKELQERLEKLKDDVLKHALMPGNIDAVVLQYCRRRIDRTLKSIDFKEAADTSELAEMYSERTSALDIEAVALEARSRIESALENRDLESLLKNYDCKGLLALAASGLKNTNLKSFKSWLMRAMLNGNETKFRTEVRKVLPVIEAS